MNAIRIKTPRLALGKLLLNETRLAWRTPTGLFGGVFPSRPYRPPGCWAPRS
jgi:hypothetical protein